MAKIEGGPKLSQPKMPKALDVAKTPSPVGPVPLPMPNVANAPVGDTGFSSAAKKLVSITGRYKGGQSAPLAGNILSVKQAEAAGPVTKAMKLNAPPEIGQLLGDGMKIKMPPPDPNPKKRFEYTQRDVDSAKKHFGEAQAALAKTPPDYKAASTAMGQLTNMDETPVTNLSNIDAVKTVQAQVDFLAKMKDAKIDASYPPTEAQLVAYFSSKGIKNDPDAARAALGEYTKAFHEHPSNVPGAAPDVVYSADSAIKKGSTSVTTHVPKSWNEVLQRPLDKAQAGDGDTVRPKSENIAKQVNDCEGFAFMSEKLLTAAGFQVKQHVTLNKTPPPKPDQHAMVEFTHPKEKGQVTVTSNQGVFHDTESEALKQGWSFANGGNSTGAEKYYSGKSMQDSQANAVVADGKSTIAIKD